MRTRSDRAAAFVALVALVALVPVRGARAHDASSPLAVAVELERGRVGVYVRYTVERGEAARALREQFDRDADGRFDDEERARLRDFLAERATAALTVRVGGVALAFVTRSVDAELEGGSDVDARVAVALRLVAKVTWPAGTSTLSIGVELPDARAVTPVGVRVGNASVGQLSIVPEDLGGGVASRRAPLELQVKAVALRAPAPRRARPAAARP
jgi:hypothetical protein